MNQKNKATLGKFEQILKVRRYSSRTIELYVHYVKVFLGHFSKPSLHITKKEVEDFLLGYHYSSISQQNQVISGVKLFVKYFLPFKIHNLVGLERPRKETKVKKVIDRDYLLNKLYAMKNIKHKCIVAFGYSCGMRVSEVINLQVKDIDSKRMLVHIRQGKGKKDRLVKLSPNHLEWLRDYYKQYRPKVYMFEGQNGQYSRSSCNRIVKNLFGEECHFHILRHSYATHQFEAGTDSAIIQNQMGHARQSTTMGYAHISNNIIQMSADLV